MFWTFCFQNLGSKAGSTKGNESDFQNLGALSWEGRLPLSIMKKLFWGATSLSLSSLLFPKIQSDATLGLGITHGFTLDPPKILDSFLLAVLQDASLLQVVSPVLSFLLFCPECWRVSLLLRITFPILKNKWTNKVYLSIETALRYLKSAMALTIFVHVFRIGTGRFCFGIWVDFSRFQLPGIISTFAFFFLLRLIPVWDKTKIWKNRIQDYLYW